MGRYVEDAVATEAERRVVALGTGMLDEEQGGTDGDAGGKMADGRRAVASDDIGIEQGLQIVI